MGHIFARARLYSPSCREGFFPETRLPLNDVLGNRGFRILHLREYPYKKRRGEDSNLRRQPRRRCGLRGRCIQPLSATSPEEKIAYTPDRCNRQMTHICLGPDPIPRETEKGSTRRPDFRQMMFSKSRSTGKGPGLLAFHILGREKNGKGTTMRY